MKQNVCLYIDGVLADCDPSTLVQMTYTREELGNPSVVRNAYSQGLTLPGTAVNDRIFSHYHRNDYLTGAGFNPAMRLPFLLQRDTGEVVERGYLKLNSVAFEGAFARSYDCTLYGGLGGFFYGLSYNADGSKKTLADLWYQLFEEAEFHPSTTLWGMTAQDVKTAWSDLENERETAAQFINYVPCYNGFPSCKFSADKGVYKAGATAATQVANLYTSKDGYTTRADAEGYALIELEHQHTEWETGDLRAYLMRPAIRVKHLLAAFSLPQNSGGYTFRLDSSRLFSEDNDYYENAWITLPMFDRDNIDPYQFYLSSLLQGTATPADYLIGFAKLFGCVFDYDAASNTITMMARDAFYDTGLPTIDLTGRIDTGKARTVVPFPFSHKYYDLSLPVSGEFAERYAEKYGRVFGSQRIDTGYDFDAEAEDVFSGNPYKGCADALESSRDYCVYGGDVDSEYGASINYNLRFAFTERVSWRLYKTDASGEETELECAPTPEPIRRLLYAEGYADFLPKPQMHGADNKGVDGSNVLLLFNGWVETPKDEQGGVLIDEAEFRLTDDTDGMLAANAGVPCWNFSPSDGVLVESFPSFRRWSTIGGVVAPMLDFGKSREYITPETPGAAATTMYDNWWKAYLEDRYNVDSRVLKCSVNLRGLGVISALLRRFFWWDGSVWTLNRISNHSITTLDTTECEFVRIQDMENYINGQMV